MDVVDFSYGRVWVDQLGERASVWWTSSTATALRILGSLALNSLRCGLICLQISSHSVEGLLQLPSWDSRTRRLLKRIAVRESNQVGFDEQIFSIPLSFPLDILPICPAGKAFGLKKICCVKTARTRERMHFWWILVRFCEARYQSCE